MNSIQIALFGVVGTLLALQFKSGKSEYGIYVSLGCRTDEYSVENGRCDLCG